MRRLVRILAKRMAASRIGRWALIVILFVIGVAGIVSYPSSPGSKTSTENLTGLVTGIVCAGLGALLLMFTIRLEFFQRGVKRAKQQGLDRAKQLEASGLLLPIPGLPPLPGGLNPEVVARIEAYAEHMKKLPWGDDPRVSDADAPHVFTRTVARVRRIRGDWRQLQEPIDIFVGLPRPLCFVGAAEVMHRLSYITGTTFSPVGLRQGLRFIGRSQYTQPTQPDALVIRTKLLASSSSKTWLELADQTLERLRQVAPNHLRLPDAEAAIHLRRGEYEAAIACFERLISNPPSPEEQFVAYANRASALESLHRYDEALDAYQQVLRIDPNDAWVWHNASLLLLKQGRLREALEANTRALSIMDFSNARSTRERILAGLSQSGESTDNSPSR